MGRRRRQDGERGRSTSALKAFLICLLIAGVAVGYVRQRQEIDRLRIEHLEKRKVLEALQIHNQGQELRRFHLHTGSQIAPQVQRHGLDLGPVRSGQVVVLSWAEGREGLLAQSGVLGIGEREVVP
jgi:hypothetical protein